MAEETKNGALGISANIDTGNNSKNAQEFVKDLDKMERAADRLAETIDDTEKYLKNIGTTAGTSGKELKDSLSNVVGEFQKFSKDAKVGAESSEAMAKAMDDFNTRLSGIPKAVGEINAHIENLKSKSEELTTAMKNVSQGTSEYDQLNKQLQINSTTIYNCQKMASELSASYDSVVDVIGDTKLSYEGLTAAMAASTAVSHSSTAAQVGNAGAKVAQVGSTMAVANAVEQETAAVRENTEAKIAEKEAEDALTNNNLADKYANESAALRDLLIQADELNSKIKGVDTLIEESTSDNTTNGLLESRKKLLDELAETEEKIKELREAETVGLSVDKGTTVSGGEMSVLDDTLTALKQARDDALKAVQTAMQEDGESTEQFKERYAQLVEAWEEAKRKFETATYFSNDTQNNDSLNIKTYEEATRKIQDYEDEIDVLNMRIEEMSGKWGPLSIAVGQFFGKFQDIKEAQDEIEVLQGKIDELKEHMSMSVDKQWQKGLKDSIETTTLVDSSYTSGGVKIPVYFETEKAYQQAEDLVTRINTLRTEIREYNGDNGGLLVKVEELAQTEQQLNALQTVAMDAANKIGGELGASIGETTIKLYELNGAVSRANKEFEDASTKVADAAKELRDVQKSGSGEEIAEATAKWEQANAEYHKAAEELRTLKQEQENTSSALASLNSQLEKQNSIVVGLFGGLSQYEAKLKGMPMMLMGMVDGLVSTEIAATKTAKWLWNVVKIPIGLLVHPIRTVRAAMIGLNAVMKAFALNPIGLVVMTLVGAFKLFHTWLNKSEKGQKAFAVITGYLNGVLAKLTDIVLIVGDALYDMFATPTKSGKHFITLLKDGVLNAIKALFSPIAELGGLIADIFSGENIGESIDKRWGNFKKALSDAGSTFKDIYNAAGKAAENFGKSWSKGWNDWGKKSIDKTASDLAKANLSERTLALDESVKATEKADAQARMQKNLLAMRDTTLSIEERKKAIAEYKKDLDTVTKIEKDFAERRAQIAKTREKATISSIEDIIASNNAEAAVAAVDRAHTQKLRPIQMAERRIASEEKRKASQAKKQTREQESLRKLIEKDDLKRQREAEDLELQYREAMLSAISDTGEQERERRKIEHEKTLLQIKREAEDRKVSLLQMAEAEWKTDTKTKNTAFNLAEYKKAHPEFDELYARIDQLQQGRTQAVTYSYADALSSGYKSDVEKQQEKQQKILADIKDIEQAINEEKAKGADADDKLISKLQARKKEAERLYATIPDELKSYELKRSDVERKYNEQIANLQSVMTNTTDNSVKEEIQKAIAKATENKAKELLDLDFKKLTDSPEYVRAFENLNRTSSETLLSLIKQFEAVKKSAAKNLRPDELKAFTDAIEKMNAVLVERDPFKALANSFKRVKETSKELREAQSILKRVQGGEMVWTGKMDTKTKLPVFYDEKTAQDNVTRKTNDNNAALDEQAQAIQKSVSLVTDTLNQLADSIGGVAGQIMKSVSSLASNVASNYGVLQQNNAQGWLAAAQIGIQAITSGMSIIMGMATKYDKAALKQDKINDITDAVRAYRDAVREARQAEQEWFAKTGVSSLRHSWEDSIDAIENYNAKLNEQQVAYQDKKSGLSRTWAVIAGGIGGAILGGIKGVFTGGPWGAAIGAIAGAAVGTATQIAMNSATESVGNMVSAKNNLRVQTRHSTWFRDEKTQDLQGWIDENMQSTARKLGVSIKLFKENGELNLELAKAVLDSGATLVGQTRETLEELIAYQEKIEEYHKELQNYVSELYSPLLEDMNNALWDWFEEGKDAMDAFYDYASETFKKVGKELTKDMINQYVFDDLKDQLKDVTENYIEGKIDDTKYAEQIAEVTNKAAQKYEDTLPKLQNFLENYDASLDNIGVDISGSSGEAQGAVNNAMSITEDTANQLVGRMTAVQIGVEQQTITMRELMMYSEQTYESVISVKEDTAAIRSSMTTIYQGITEIRDMQESSLSVLNSIATNTAELYAVNEKLSEISSKLD